MSRLSQVLVSVALMLVAVITFAAAPTNHAAAQQDNKAAVTVIQSTDSTPTAATPPCTDQKLIDGITADAKSIGDDLGKVSSTGAGGVYSIMINIANTRLKYEDMTTPTDPGCNYLVTETIVLFANVEDLGLVSMGTKLGLDTTTDQATVLTRLEKQVKKVNALIGVVPTH